MLLRVGYTIVWSGIHECKTYTTTDYGITYLFHDRRARANIWANVQRDKLVTLQWSGLWDVISLQTLC